jgi:hypothetical protein
MKLHNVTFSNWLASHGDKDADERWLRELYPWPVLAQLDCDDSYVGVTQRITHDDVMYLVKISSKELQDNGKHRYRIRIDSEGLGWHARSFADDYDMIAAPDGNFVTIYNVAGKDKEPLEKIAKAFFNRRWKSLSPEMFRTLAVSRFLSASLIGEIAEAAFAPTPLEHYPGARLVGGAPMLADHDKLWIGHRFYSENAYEWARKNAGRARRVIGVYLADTKYQFRVDLPPNAEVVSASALDEQALDGRHSDLIRVLLRRLEVPMFDHDPSAIASALSNRSEHLTPVSISEGDVHESLAALKSPCRSKEDLRYQLAAAVVLNAWIEAERRLGYKQRKRFYAFKQRVDYLARWAVTAGCEGITVWREDSSTDRGPILFVRIDNVDFSFHAITLARELPNAARQFTWSGVRLKPIAPLVLAWARELRSSPHIP